MSEDEDVQHTELASPDATRAAADPAALERAEAAVAAEWQVSDVVLDLYEVTDLLGEGGMGRVYKVHHRGWNVDLAVKTPRPEIFATAGGAENFVREAETWVNLGLHPHTVSCYYVRTLGGIPRVFAEYVEGGSLADWIRTKKLYQGGAEKALERILDIAIQFAWGLHYAHEQGLVHQDVKPANVMMTPDGVAKVTDFGLAKARASAGERAGAAVVGASILVSSGGMTPAYCSPEQAAGLPLSRGTDTWSWGLSVLEMFTGEVTWLAGQAAAEALESYLESSPEERAAPTMPDGIAALLQRCFSQTPDARPRDLQQVAEALQALYEKTIGRAHSQPRPQAAALTADTLNNRALSYFDLGKQQEADREWRAALRADPQHLETTYNHGAVRWRRGDLTDMELLAELEAVQSTRGDSWPLRYMRALVHLERWDVDSAIEELMQASRQAPHVEDVAALLKRAYSGDVAAASRSIRTVALPAAWRCVVVNGDGRWGLWGGYKGLLQMWDTESGRVLRSFEGHEGDVTSVSLSADGKRALSASEDFYTGKDVSLRFWDVDTGQCIRVLRHEELFMLVWLSADARWALSVGSPVRRGGSTDHTDHIARFWDMATGQCVRVIEGPAVCLSADGRWAVMAPPLSGRFFRLWDMATGRKASDFFGCKNDVVSFCASTDRRVALSAGQDNILRLWELSSGKCLRTIEGSRTSPNLDCLSTDGTLALGYGPNHTLQLWDVATGRCLRTYEGHRDKLFSIAFIAQDSHACSASSDGTVRFWELPRHVATRASFQLSRVASHAAISQIEKQVALLLAQSQTAIRETRFTDALAHLRHARTLPGYERNAECLTAWRSLADCCRRVNLRASWPTRVLATSGGCLRTSPDGRWVFSTDEDDEEGTIRQWDIASGECVRVFSQTYSYTRCLCVSPDGRLLLSGGSALRLWDLCSGNLQREFNDHQGRVNAVGFDPDLRWIFSVGQDSTWRLWDINTGRCLRVVLVTAPIRDVILSFWQQALYRPSFIDHYRGWRKLLKLLKHLQFAWQGRHERHWAACLSSDGRHIATGSGDALGLWDVASGHRFRTFSLQQDAMTSASLSPNDRCLLSQSSGLRLWDVLTGRCLLTLADESARMTSACISSDGRWALSGSSDNTMRLWDLISGGCVRSFDGHTKRVHSVHLSADGRWAISGSLDGTVRVWELDWELEAREPADWDDEALPYLQTFLMRHTPYAGAWPSANTASEAALHAALSRRGQPAWTENDFSNLMGMLGKVGYGWLRAEGVRRKLEEIASNPCSPA